MRNMSFMLTKEQIRNKTKTVTRRTGWRRLKAGEIVMAVEKCQGLKKGEKMDKICPIKIIDVSMEMLGDITPEEVVKEGFPEMGTIEFIDMFCRTHKGVNYSTIITRIEFEYI